MDAAAETGRNLVSKHQPIRLSTDQSDQSDSARVRRISGLTQDATAEPVSRDQILRRERGQGKKKHFSCLADHEKDSQNISD